MAEARKKALGGGKGDESIQREAERLITGRDWSDWMGRYSEKVKQLEAEQGIRHSRYPHLTVRLVGELREGEARSRAVAERDQAKANRANQTIADLQRENGFADSPRFSRRRATESCHTAWGGSKRTAEAAGRRDGKDGDCEFTEEREW